MRRGMRRRERPSISSERREAQCATPGWMGFSYWLGDEGSYVNLRRVGENMEASISPCCLYLYFRDCGRYYSTAFIEADCNRMLDLPS